VAAGSLGPRDSDRPGGDGGEHPEHPPLALRTQRHLVLRAGKRAASWRSARKSALRRRHLGTKTNAELVGCRAEAATSSSSLPRVQLARGGDGRGLARKEVESQPRGWAPTRAQFDRGLIATRLWPWLDRPIFVMAARKSAD